MKYCGSMAMTASQNNFDLNSNLASLVPQAQGGLSVHKHQAIAADFLSEWSTRDETFAFLVRYPDDARLLQRIICLTDLLSRNYLGWLAFENYCGGNVYFSINPLAPKATRRIKDVVIEAKALYLDLDLDGDAKLAAIHRSESVPPPSAVIQTSKGKLPSPMACLWVLDFRPANHVEDSCGNVWRRPRLHRLLAGLSPAGILQSEIHSRDSCNGRNGRL